MQVRVKFLVSGANSLVGGYCAGDIGRVSAALAKHLVEEVGCAKYIDAPAAPAPVADPIEPAPVAEVKPAKAKKGAK